MILAIGDSHASLFSGQPGLSEIGPRPRAGALPGIRSARLGPYLAHSVAQPRHAVRRLLHESLRAARSGDALLLVFGEIDCRCHVVPRAALSRRTIERTAAETAARYVRAARTLAGTDRTLGFWGVPPPCVEAAFNPEFPTRGTFAQRLRAARAFNRALSREAKIVGAAVFDVFDEVATARGRPRARFFLDEVHLGPASLPPAVERLIEAGWVRDPAPLRSAAAAVARILPRPVSRPIDPPGPRRPSHLGTPEALTRALVDRAALECVSLGARRIALFGAGRHTRRIGTAPYLARGLKVAAILDDAPPCERLFGAPVLRPDSPAWRADAVVISSDSSEEKLAQRARRFAARRGVPVVRIYGGAAVPIVRSAGA